MMVGGNSTIKVQNLVRSILQNAKLPRVLENIVYDSDSGEFGVARQGFGCNDAFSVFAFLAFLLALVQLIQDMQRRKKRSVDQCSESSTVDEERLTTEASLSAHIMFTGEACSCIYY